MERDGLTGLSTRNQLIRDLAEAGRLFAVFFDIDALVRLTDMHGWQFSEDAIVSVGNVIRDHAQVSGCPAYRVGGDEFLVTLDGRSQAEARLFALTVVDAVFAAQIFYARADDPSRKNIAVNAVVFQASPVLGLDFSQLHEWLVEQIWIAKGHDLSRFGVIADASAVSRHRVE